MDPLKPSNPPSKELVEEVVHIAQLHLNNAMQDTQNQMDGRFGMLVVDLAGQIGEIHNRFENDKYIADSRHESLMENLKKLLAEKETQPNATVHRTSGTVHRSDGTVHRSVGIVHTVVLDATVHPAVENSGITQNLYSIPTISTPIPHLSTPLHTPPLKFCHLFQYTTTSPHNITPFQLNSTSTTTPFSPLHFLSYPFSSNPTAP